MIVHEICQQRGCTGSFSVAAIFKRAKKKFRNLEKEQNLMKKSGI